MQKWCNIVDIFIILLEQLCTFQKSTKHYLMELWRNRTSCTSWNVELLKPLTKAKYTWRLGNSGKLAWIRWKFKSVPKLILDVFNFKTSSGHRKTVLTWVFLGTFFFSSLAYISIKRKILPDVVRAALNDHTSKSWSAPLCQMPF